MIKTLRRKFIAIAMLAIFIVLAAIIGGINIANYININETADQRLKILSDNKGFFPSSKDSEKENLQKDEFQNKGMQQPEPDQEQNQEPEQEQEPGMNQDKPRSISPEAPFDTRYFTVVINKDGNVLSTNTGKIASVSADTAKSYALSAYSDNKTSGFTECYKYCSLNITSDSGEENTMYIFLNCERELNTFKSFLFSSVAISLAGLFIVFILVLIFSKIVLKPVAESYEKQKRFITDASHEIKTPLTIIDANTEVIEMEYGESEWSESIHKQIKRLSSLTEKLVLLSRMDEESVYLTMDDFSLSDAIADTAESFKTVAVSNQKSLSIFIEPDIMYHGNEASIRQLISLLLDNAVKYSSINHDIHIKLHSNGKSKVITVFNYVEDIPIGKLDILFERFYRTDSSRNSSTGGYGIGLSVAKAIVLAHKGKINARSDDGHSIIFTIVL